MGSILVLAMPGALLLLVPAAALWWWQRRRAGAVLRALLLLALVLAAARPELALGSGGSDVVLVVDRSASLGALRAGHDGLLRAIAAQRGRHDRLGVVAFADSAHILQSPQPAAVPRLADAGLDEGGSDLAAGLDAAAALIAPGRSTRVIVISDGEDTGADPRPAAARLAGLRTQASVVLDALPQRLPGSGDAAVVDVEAPGELRLGEGTLAAVRLTSDRRERRSWRVVREARPGSPEVALAGGTADLVPGQATAVIFADRPPGHGLWTWRIELDASDDRKPGNNSARACVRVAGGEDVLVISGDGTPGHVARALLAAGLTVRSRGEGPLTLDDLAGIAALVLDNVPADRIGFAGIEAIAAWTRDLGGGLIMLGGRRSFGSGGWHRSAVEDVLPVSLELRDEHRKLAVAMAITLDRSGSMSAPVGGGRTKMHLADEGAAAAIALLGPLDSVAVHAVDSEPHVVVRMQRVTHPQHLIDQVLGIRSQGGGIFVYQALLGAAAELEGMTNGTRHIVLFADAADAEEPGEYIDLLARLRRVGVTVSVVAMGTNADPDARFLEDVAARGGGRISYAAAPGDIPRLFAQETVLVARSSYVDTPTRPQPLPGLGVALPRFAAVPEQTGPGQAEPWPLLPGFNLTYARPRASVLALCPGDPQGPAIAAWRIGSGRAVAVPFPCDSADAPDVPAWSRYGELLAGLVRYAAGRHETAPGALTATRRGREVTWQLELDPARPVPAQLPDLVLLGPDAPSATVAFEPIDAHTYRATTVLRGSSVLWAATALKGAEGPEGAPVPILAPPQLLPYSPELSPRLGLPSGERILAGLAREVGGRLRDDVLDVFANPPSPGLRHALAPWLIAAALVLLVAEIAARRFGLAPLQALQERWRRRAASRSSQAAESATATTTAPAASAPKPDSAPSPRTPSPRTPPSPPTPSPGGLHDALEQLRRRR